MRETPATARNLVTTHDLGASVVRMPPSSLRIPGSSTRVPGNSAEKRITVSFLTADAPTPVYHGLGFAPSGYTVVSCGSARVYNDVPLPSTTRVIVLRCDTANTVAEVIVR